jgi:hypothetical protein
MNARRCHSGLYSPPYRRLVLFVELWYGNARHTTLKVAHGFPIVPAIPQPCADVGLLRQDVYE